MVASPEPEAVGQRSVDILTINVFVSKVWLIDHLPLWKPVEIITYNSFVVSHFYSFFFGALIFDDFVLNSDFIEFLYPQTGHRRLDFRYNVSDVPFLKEDERQLTQEIYS